MDEEKPMTETEDKDEIIIEGQKDLASMRAQPDNSLTLRKGNSRILRGSYAYKPGGFHQDHPS